MRRIAICVFCGFLVGLAALATSSPAQACDIVVGEVSVFSADADVLVVRERNLAARSVVVSRGSVFGSVVLLEERPIVVRRQRAPRLRLFSTLAAPRVIVVR